MQRGASVIVEHAVLNVKSGEEEAFIVAVTEGLPLLAATEGFLSAKVSRGIESPSTFILDVEWASVEAHTEGFRGSERFATWKALTHHFYEPFPVVEHFAPIAES